MNMNSLYPSDVDPVSFGSADSGPDSEFGAGTGSRGIK